MLSSSSFSFLTCVCTLGIRQRRAKKKKMSLFRINRDLFPPPFDSDFYLISFRCNCSLRLILIVVVIGSSRIADNVNSLKQTHPSKLFMETSDPCQRDIHRQNERVESMRKFSHLLAHSSSVIDLRAFAFSQE